MKFVKNNLYKIAIPFACIAVTMTSCKKFVEVPPPNNQVVSATIFSDDNTATAAWIGVYNNIMQTYRFLSCNITVFTSNCSDELSFWNPAINPFLKNNITADNSDIEAMWQQAYQYIYQANAVIKGLQESTGVTGITRKQLIGEAKFIRALCYFYLINLWGDVPLITSTDYLENASTPRTLKTQVYQQIITDLKDAQNLLIDNYVKFDNTAYTTNPEKIRPNKLTATALLSRVYLYLNDWGNAEVQSSLIINSGRYSLATLNNSFLKNNSEAIWQLMPVNASYNTLEGNRFIPYAINAIDPNYPLTNNLLNAFESGDQRKTAWVGIDVYSGVTYYFPYKYKIYSGNNPLNEYYIVFRLAEQYLIRAEARAQQNNISGSQSDLNTIRNRAFSTPNPTTANDKASLLLAIEHERQVELFAEWGHRWLDLNRTGRIDAVLAPIKGANWQATDALWPIPQSQINTNSNLTQNPGY